MEADRGGKPYIASYWRAAGSNVPQYQVLYRSGGAWTRMGLDFRSMPFSLNGQGTKAIPIARPQIMLDQRAGPPSGLLVFRDQERGSKVSVVTIADFAAQRWSVRDLGDASVGAWEPSYDTELWRRDGVLNLYVQDVRQVDAEGSAAVAPSMVRVLQWTPPFLPKD